MKTYRTFYAEYHHIDKLYAQRVELGTATSLSVAYLGESGYTGSVAVPIDMSFVQANVTNVPAAAVDGDGLIAAYQHNSADAAIVLFQTNRGRLVHTSLALPPAAIVIASGFDYWQHNKLVLLPAGEPAVMENSVGRQVFLFDGNELLLIRQNLLNAAARLLKFPKLEELL